MGDDFRIRNQLIAPEVIPVVMRVHHSRYGLPYPRGDGLEHLLRQGQIEEGVDQERLILPGDQPCVAPPEALILLHVPVSPVRELHQAELGVFSAHLPAPVFDFKRLPDFPQANFTSPLVRLQSMSVFILLRKVEGMQGEDRFSEWMGRCQRGSFERVSGSYQNEKSA
jgi:hypothetical protein